MRDDATRGLVPDVVVVRLVVCEGPRAASDIDMMIYLLMTRHAMSKTSACAFLQAIAQRFISKNAL